MKGISFLLWRRFGHERVDLIVFLNGIAIMSFELKCKQAIEEGFILDVLQNYTTYNTFYQINKEIEEDPRCKTTDVKRQIARFVELHETNITQRVEVIVEHFRTTVMPELGGMAKAMVITASRQAAVKYRQAFENYTRKKDYSDIKALVAFSGKVKLFNDETEYTEASMNGFPEAQLPKVFDTDAYQVLLVANKYQTGFDQPKLCAMYVLKKLKGVSAIQTLSRLNRICPPFEKKTFVLDFVNSYEDIKSAFAPHYTTTLLSNSVTPTAIYDLEAQIDAYTVLDPADIEAANDLLYQSNISSKDKQKPIFYFKRSKNMIEAYDLLKQHEIVAMMRFQGNNSTYQMLVSLCQLVLEGMLLTTDSGEYRLATFLDEPRMNRLYEKFILEYCAKECPQVKAAASQIPWALEPV